MSTPNRPVEDRRNRQAAVEKLQRYSAVAVILHWSIAGFILFNLATGFFMEGFAPPLKHIVVPLHVSSGMTILTLTAARIVWRLTHRPPPFLPGKPWEHAAAHLVHGLLYALMLIMPLSGWSIVSAHPAHGGRGSVLWGVIPLPPIGPIAQMAAPAQRIAHATFVESHTIAGWILLSVLILHVAAAVKHQLIDRQRILARMSLSPPAAVD
ncbi:MAG: cytochrome b [Caulobacteraceae bacterium]